MRGIVAAAGLAVLAGAAHAQTAELRFPADQFDRAAYRPTQATGNPRYEAILTDMREANFEALANFDGGDDVRRMAEPVGLLKVMLRSNEYITCTASVIDKGLVLTNWHCLPKFGEEATKAALWMGFYSDDERGTEGYPVELRPVESNQALDFAILRVSGDLDKWGRIQLAAEDPPANRSLAIVHHPAGRPKQLTQRSCRTADPAFARGELRHKCDTLEGSSGAPVFFGAGASARVVALHFAGVPQSVRGVDPAFEANLAMPISRIAAASAVVQRLVQPGGVAPAPAVPAAGAPAAASRWEPFDAEQLTWPSVKSAVSRARNAEREARLREVVARRTAEQAAKTAEMARAQGPGTRVVSDSVRRLETAVDASGRASGYGVMTVIGGPAAGDRFLGVFRDGLIKEGLFEFAENESNSGGTLTYHGEFANEKKAGYGVEAWRDGDRYSGAFVADKPGGYGVYVWANGEKYEGEWREGRETGYGALWNADGSLKGAGVWEAGALKQAMAR